MSKKTSNKLEQLEPLYKSVGPLELAEAYGEKNSLQLIQVINFSGAYLDEPSYEEFYFHKLESFEKLCETLFCIAKHHAKNNDYEFPDMFYNDRITILLGGYWSQTVVENINQGLVKTNGREDEMIEWFKKNTHKNKIIK